MESKEGIDALFLYATEGILVVNHTGEIVRINPSAEKLFGYARGELSGQKIEILIPGRFASQHTEYREKYNQHPHARAMGAGMELFGKKKDGSEIPVEISLSPYTNQEGKFVIAFIIDISLRKQAEERLKNYSVELENQVKNRTLILEEAITELERTKQDLHHALEREKELGELKSRFVSTASHEFRTPLATMMTSLALIKRYGEQNDIASQAQYVGKIKSSIHALTDILDDLLSVSKLEEGKIMVMAEEVDLGRFIGGTVAEMQGLTDNGQTLLHTHTGSGAMVTDKKILRHILLNILSNAIKFSPNGEPVEITSEIKNDRAHIAVADKGIGVPEADQKHLFGRFFRAHNAANIQGTGLGLNIVARYLELLGGDITFTSRANAGTTFYISLPRTQQPD